MKATTFRKTVKNRRFFWMSDWFSLVISAPVRTSVSDALPRVDSMRLASSSSLTEPSPRTCHGVDEAGLGHEPPAPSAGRTSEKWRRRGSRRRRSGRCPERELALAPVAPAIWILSPTAKWPLSALPLSMATWSPPCGLAPSTKLHVARSPVSATEPNVGGAVCPETSALPSLPMMLAKPMTSPCASETPGTALTSAMTESGSRSRCLLPKSASITLDERT